MVIVNTGIVTEGYAYATCPSSAPYVLGGGYALDENLSETLFAWMSEPTGSATSLPEGWEAGGEAAATVLNTAHAICSQ